MSRSSYTSRSSSFKSTSASSSKTSGNGSNMRLYVVLGILAFAIIIGTIIGSSYKSNEKFSNPKPAYTLVFLYMEGCGHCVDFKKEWEIIVPKVEENKTYNFTTSKLDLNDDGKTIATANGITYAPAILLKKNSDSSIIEYNGKRTAKEIIEFAVKNAI